MQTIIGAGHMLEGRTLTQACFENWIKTGYRDSSANRQAEYLLAVLERQPQPEDKRCLLVHNHQNFTLRKRLITLLGILSTLTDEDTGSPLVIAKQFAVLLVDTTTSFSSHVSQDVEVVLNKGNPVGLIEFLWWVYEVQNKQSNEPTKLSLVCENLSIDNLYEMAMVFDDKVSEYGSFPAYLESMLGENAQIHYTTPGDLQAEASLPKPPALAWSEPSSPNKFCHYDHCVAKTPFGELRIEWKEHKDIKGYSCLFPFGDEPFVAEEGLLILNENTLEEAKAKVYEFYTYYIRRALGHTVRKPRV